MVTPSGALVLQKQAQRGPWPISDHKAILSQSEAGLLPSSLELLFPVSPRFPGSQTSYREFPALLACLVMGRKREGEVVGQLPRWPTFLRRAQPCLLAGAGGAAAWVYLELLLAVPGPQASRISSSQLSRKPGLSAAKQDKNSFSCLLTELGKGLVPPLPLIIASLLAVPGALDQI